jgi:isopenicillin N synthase-like dioxygenase
VGARKLPTRDRGNRNEAFVVKSGSGISMDQNQWPDGATLSGMRALTERYGDAMTTLSMALLPLYAVALDLESDFFKGAFTSPFYRLRMTHYPPLGNAAVEDFSIAPHVDSTFFTILARESAGLTIYSETQNSWLQVPQVEGALIVNTGELLRQWSNDRFVSVKHFVRNHRDTSRYSIPYFLNADADHVMECLPTCWGPSNPPKYPPISYLQSQAIAQGE